jgi:hypothetical protein
LRTESSTSACFYDATSERGEGGDIGGTGIHRDSRSEKKYFFENFRDTKKIWKLHFIFFEKWSAWSENVAQHIAAIPVSGEFKKSHRWVALGFGMMRIDASHTLGFFRDVHPTFGAPQNF